MNCLRTIQFISGMRICLIAVAIIIVCFQASAQNADTLNRKRLRTVVYTEAAVYLSGNAFLQWVWYKDHARVPFHFYNDGKGYLQLDKCGHAFGAYQYSRKGYEALRWAGVSRKKALIFGGPLGIVLQSPIEIFDGLYEGYGFSNGDMLANTAGSVLFSVQQAIWDRQFIKMKFSYAPSPYAAYNPGKLGENQMQRFFMDYNGHSYWLSLNAGDLFPKSKIPPYISIAFGYSANGMLGEFSNPLFVRRQPVPYFERTRQYFFSLDIDLSKIKTKSRFLKALLNQINSIKVPFPALEYNRIQKFRFRPLYF